MTTDTPLELSVCTVARTSDDQLPRFLDGFAQQSAPRGSFEIVVVDATTDGAWADAGATAPVPVRVVRAPAETSYADALNTAWRAAAAPAVAFLGVHLTPARGWAESMAYALSRGRRVVTAAVQPNPDSLDRAGSLSHRLWASQHELPLVGSEQMGCLRGDLERVGGWDPTVPVKTCDVDLAARLVDDGVDHHLARHVVAFHDVDETDLTSMLAARGAARDSIDALAGYPRARARLLVGGVFWHRRNVEALVAAAGVVAATRDRRALLLTAPWIHERTCLAPRTGGPRRKWFILPGVFAFDLYDAVTTTAARLRPMRPR